MSESSFGLSSPYTYLGFYLLLSKRRYPTIYNLGRELITGTVYLNSYLASLNARQGLREMSNQPVSIQFTNFAQSSGRFTNASEGEESRPTELGEKVGFMDAVIAPGLNSSSDHIRRHCHSKPVICRRDLSQIAVAVRTLLRPSQQQRQP